MIKAFCKLCLATYAVNAVVAIALWPARQSKESPVALGRLALTAWAIAAAGIASGVLAWNGALGARAANRAGTLLGRTGDLGRGLRRGATKRSGRAHCACAKPSTIRRSTRTT